MRETLKRQGESQANNCCIEVTYVTDVQLTPHLAKDRPLPTIGDSQHWPMEFSFFIMGYRPLTQVTDSALFIAKDSLTMLS